tara:strand:+ start:1839 stop:1958 length:120 start_codon:yes stop_codon:yes gene_type:complete
MDYMREFIDLIICLVIYSFFAFSLFNFAIWLQKEFNLFS